MRGSALLAVMACACTGCSLLIDIPLAADAGVGTQIADSVGEFSGVQGENGWSYGVIVPFGDNSFVDLGYDAGRQEWVVDPDQYWTSIAERVMRPNGSIAEGGKLGLEHHAVRRWTSEVTGPAVIDVVVARAATGGNGVDVRVVVDGEELWSQFLGADDLDDVTQRLETTLRSGAKVDFVLEPHGVGPDTDGISDDTRFEATIAVP